MSALPRILLVGHLVGPQLFGAERSLLDLAAAIDRRRFGLVCAFPARNEAYLQQAARHAEEVCVFPYRWWSEASPVDEAAVARFSALYESRGIALVHVNTITLLEPLVAARRLGVPAILHARELVDRDPVLARRLGGDPAAIVRRITDAADFVIANSDATHRLFRKPGRSFLLYNSVDLARFDLPAATVGRRLSERPATPAQSPQSPQRSGSRGSGAGTSPRERASTRRANKQFQLS